VDLLPKFDGKETWAAVYKIRENPDFRELSDYIVGNIDWLEVVSEKANFLQAELETFLNGSWTPGKFGNAINRKWHEKFYRPSTSNPTPPKVVKRWADYSSDEDNNLIMGLSSLNKEQAKTSPGITIPKDTSDYFPVGYSRLNRFCQKHDWTLTTSELKFSDQGIQAFQTMEDGTIKLPDKASDSLKNALQSLLMCFALISVSPDSLAERVDHDVAITYMCSIVAREKLFKKDKALAAVALKNGDGGRSVFVNRLMFLTQTGSSAIKELITAIEKVFLKFAQEIKEDKLDENLVEYIATHAFTSEEGMMSNVYRKNWINATRMIDSYDNRGRKIKKQEKYKKLHVSLPDIQTSPGIPLKPEEVSKLNELKEKFNDRKSQMKLRIESIDKTKITLADKPRVAKEIVEQAYAKLNPYSLIIKERINLIRSKAKSKSKNENDPIPQHAWVEARVEVLKETATISDAIYGELTW